MSVLCSRLTAGSSITPQALWDTLALRAQTLRLRQQPRFPKREQTALPLGLRWEWHLRIALGVILPFP